MKFPLMIIKPVLNIAVKASKFPHSEGLGTWHAEDKCWVLEKDNTFWLLGFFNTGKCFIPHFAVPDTRRAEAAGGRCDDKV